MHSGPMVPRPTQRKHADPLDQCERERYMNKMAAVEIGPYETEKENLSDDVDKLPLISYYDKVNYVVNTKSAYAVNELHCLKFMDAYN